GKNLRRIDKGEAGKRVIGIVGRHDPAEVSGDLRRDVDIGAAHIIADRMLGDIEDLEIVFLIVRTGGRRGVIGQREKIQDLLADAARIELALWNHISLILNTRGWVINLIQSSTGREALREISSAFE